MERRRVLLLAGGSLSVALSGCVDEFGGDDDSEATDDSTNGADNADDGSDDVDDDASDDAGDDDGGESSDDGEGSGDDTADDDAVDDPADEVDPSDDLADEPFDLGNSFVATGQGGFISFEVPEDDAEAEGVPFPVAAASEESIVVEGAVENGTWESTAVTFPTLEHELGIHVDIEAPDGFTGVVDVDEGLLTIEGRLVVTIEGEESFEFEFDATTGESGSLEGSFDFSTTPGSITVVDNEFIVDDTTGESLIDDMLPLPAVEEGTNWISITMHVDHPG